MAGGTVLALSGCVSLSIHKRTVAKTVQAANVRDATLEQLNSQLAAQYAGIKTINARVEIKVATGGQREGQVQEVIPTFSGFMLLRKPSDLRVILQLPVLGSLALDMASDGRTFKLLVPKKNVAREGSEELVNPSAKGFENLRPKVIRDALLVPAVAPDEFVSKTNNARIIPAPKGRKEDIEEPDYDLTVTRRKAGNELQTIRVIHISRVTLKPYQQDIYDDAGNLIETVNYDHYEKLGDVDYPRLIAISMPIYEYSLKIEITKLTLNEDMDDEQFALKFPEGMKVTKM
jgi:outer membrane lipoprotein-sorting protein